MREALKALGLEGDLLESVMRLHGQHNADLAANERIAKEQQAKAEAELKKYQKGGELYIDGEEHKRLKTFETETLSKETNAKKTAALTKLFKGANASDSATKLLISSSRLDELELDEKGEIKGATDILKKAQAEYADLFSANGNAGVPHANEGEGTSSNNTPRRKVF